MDEKLLLYLKGMIAPEEVAEIENWITANPEDFEKAKKVWELAKKVNIQAFNTHKSWSKFENHIHKQYRLKVYRISAIISTAAAILVLAFFLFNPFSVKNITTVANQNSEIKQVQMPDGSIVWLNTGAAISYQNDFNHSNRYLELSGKAYFEVKRNENLPFEVKTSPGKITVLGTSFNLETNVRRTSLVVTSGRVKFESGMGEVLELTENQQALLENNHLLQLPMPQANYLSWKNGEFVFVDTPLAKVASTLEEYYHVRLTLHQNLPEDITLTAQFNQDPIEEILNTIALACGVEIIKKTNGYLIVNKKER